MRTILSAILAALICTQGLAAPVPAAGPAEPVASGPGKGNECFPKGCTER